MVLNGCLYLVSNSTQTIHVKVMITRRTSVTPTPLSSIPIHTLIYRFALLGCTEEEVARNLDMDIRDFRKLLRRDPEARTAMWKGGEAANAEVAEALFKMITGYEYTEEVLVSYQGVSQVHTVRRWERGNPEAALKWLANRNKTRWGNAQQVQMAQTIINIAKVEVGDLTMEELLLAKKLGLRGDDVEDITEIEELKKEGEDDN